MKSEHEVTEMLKRCIKNWDNDLWGQRTRWFAMAQILEQVLELSDEEQDKIWRETADAERNTDGTLD